MRDWRREDIEGKKSRWENVCVNKWSLELRMKKVGENHDSKYHEGTRHMEQNICTSNKSC